VLTTRTYHTTYEHDLFVFNVHCRSAVRFVLSVSGLPYWRTPFVCVLNGLEGLAVWRLSKPKTNQKILWEGATDFFPLFLGSEYPSCSLDQTGWSRKSPLSRRVSYLAGSLTKNLEEAGPPRIIPTMCFEVVPVPPNSKHPGGGEFLQSRRWTPDVGKHSFLHLNNAPGTKNLDARAYEKCREVLWTFVTFVYRPQTHRQVFKSTWS